MKANLIFSILAILFFFSCEKVVKQNQPATANTENGQGTQAASAAPNGVVAEIGDKKIMMSDLDKEVKYEVYEAEEQIYNIKKGSLDNMIEKELVANEAKAQGMEPDALIKKEITDKIKMATAEEAKAFYDRNKDRIPQSYEEAKDRIIKYLSGDGERKRRAEYMDELKKKMNVKTFLAAPQAPVYEIPVKDSDPKKGKLDSKVVVVEYSDFQCPFCKRGHETVQEVMKAYGDKILFVYKDYPLDFHPQGKKAAEAALCARDQNKFWEFHDKIFEDSKKINDEDFYAHAKAVGLDEAKFKECYTTTKYAKEVQEDIEEGQRVGVRGTPAFFINGKKLSGAQPFSAFKEILDKELGLSN